MKPAVAGLVAAIVTAGVLLACTGLAAALVALVR